MQQRNFLIAIVISIVFLGFWYTVVIPKLAPPPSLQHATANDSSGGSSVPGSMSSLPATFSMAHPQGRDEGSSSADVILRDDRNEIVLAPQGGAVRHWRLKLKGQEVDLVESPDEAPLPLSTFDIPFTIQQTADAAVLKGNLGNGVELTKTLRLAPKGYLQSYRLEFKNTTSQPVEIKNWDLGWGPGIGTAPSERKENSRLIRAIEMGPLHAHVVKDGEIATGVWSAIDNRYFMVAFIPPAGTTPSTLVAGSKDQTRLSLRDTTTIPAKQTVALDYQLYAGPKGYTQLKQYGLHLEEGVDFGTFSPLGKVILSIIYRLQRVTNNYGIAIILLTIGLQLLLFPLTMKSLKAQLAMKRIQPKMAALQKQYKSDPKKLNSEMMNLYKTTGTNPFGGCLPMVVQLPIFWALFTTLRNAYELRGAPFVGWIHDLSAPDPFRVLPIVMGGAMFFQQRLTGNASDPTQRQMMFMMPIIFTVMFINFPSGLVLYWLTNNLIMLTFQYTYIRNQSQLGKGTADSPQVVRR